MLSEKNIAEWRRRAPSLREAEVADGETFYRQGEAPGFLYCVTRGLVRLSHVAESGAQITLAIAQAGDLFGRVSPGRASAHTASAVGDARVLLFAPSDVDRLVANNQSFSSFFSSGLEASRERAERRLIDRQTKTVAARLIETLAELALAFGAPCPHGYSLEIRLTQQDIADLVHASRPVVTRIMNDLRRRGALDYRRDLICVNHLALQALAKENPAGL
ncbi:MAG: Crp/Fnr family transcriptional regulator [Alphaproteobacteria bacterium]|nr:Crp/Fnr family transcriptional regulator [Alphaproteobacteria bacterium]MBM3653235.1 Crp/Fnr family transcriptional regulator [Alphaproteobacteria bacterium]